MIDTFHRYLTQLAFVLLLVGMKMMTHVAKQIAAR